MVTMSVTARLLAAAVADSTDSDASMATACSALGLACM